MNRQQGLMLVIGVVLILLFVGGIVGTVYFWPSNQEQRSSAFFSLLQFLAALFLIVLTFMYVKATQHYVEATQQQVLDQNQAPKFTVTRYWYQTQPFRANFAIEIANPSVRTTSVSIKAVRIGETQASELCFEVSQRQGDRATIPARDLINVIVIAKFEGIPIWNSSRQTKEVASFVFEDVFHGTLAPLTYQL